MAVNDVSGRSHLWGLMFQPHGTESGDYYKQFYITLLGGMITLLHQRTGGFTFCTFCTYGALFQGAHPRSQEQVCRLLGPVFLLLFLMYGGINEIRKFACLPVLRQ
jgi:hypothetical protein